MSFSISNRSSMRLSNIRDDDLNRDSSELDTETSNFFEDFFTTGEANFESLNPDVVKMMHSADLIPTTEEDDDVSPERKMENYKAKLEEFLQATAEEVESLDVTQRKYLQAVGQGRKQYTPKLARVSVDLGEHKTQWFEAQRQLKVLEEFLSTSSDEGLEESADSPEATPLQ